MGAIELLNQTYGSITKEEFNEAMKEVQDRCYEQFWKENGRSQIPMKVGQYYIKTSSTSKQ